MFGKKDWEKDVICRDCLAIKHTKVLTRGSRMMEWLIWSVLLIPGPLYTLYRRTGKRTICGACGSDDLIPIDSSLGWELIEKSIRKNEENPPDENSGEPMERKHVAAERKTDLQTF